ncbi:MAG: hypothetical protein ABIK39_05835 [candidate division WOR-3 bacterium]
MIEMTFVVDVALTVAFALTVKIGFFSVLNGKEIVLKVKRFGVPVFG